MCLFLLDPHAAFDTFDCHRYGFNVVLFQRIWSYLINRCQQAVIGDPEVDGASSSQKTVFDVPQDRVLCAVFFGS